MRLAGEALNSALVTAGLLPADVDYVMFTSVTGISAPSIDGLLVSRLGLRTDVKRVPMFGLGCVAGASGIARVNDYLAGHPNDVAVLLSVELCSLTFQHDDDSMANIVATGLFGDGAAAVVMVGAERARRMPVTGPDVVDSRSQHAMCARWAAERGYVVTRELLVRGLRPDHGALWSDVESGHVDLFVAPRKASPQGELF